MHAYKDPSKAQFSITVGDKTVEVDITGCDVEYDGKRIVIRPISSTDAVNRDPLQES